MRTPAIRQVACPAARLGGGSRERQGFDALHYTARYAALFGFFTVAALLA